MSRRVFVPEANNRYDLTRAEVFGEISTLLTKNLSPFDPNAPQILEAAFELNKFDPRVDYLCFTGRNTTLGIALAVALGKYKTVRVLLFDARSSVYREVVYTAGKPNGVHDEYLVEQDKI